MTKKKAFGTLAGHAKTFQDYSVAFTERGGISPRRGMKAGWGKDLPTEDSHMARGYVGRRTGKTYCRIQNRTESSKSVVQ